MRMGSSQVISPSLRFAFVSTVCFGLAHGLSVCNHCRALARFLTQAAAERGELQGRQNCIGRRLRPEAAEGAHMPFTARGLWVRSAFDAVPTEVGTAFCNVIGTCSVVCGLLLLSWSTVFDNVQARPEARQRLPEHCSESNKASRYISNPVRTPSDIFSASARCMRCLGIRSRL